MSIKTAEDWRGLREIGRIVAATLRALQAAVTEGITTGELDRTAADLVKAHGARSAPGLVYGFPGTVLISVNDEVVHGIPGPRTLRSGDLVKLDVTLEKDGYMADAARTVVVGAGSPDVTALRDSARAAFACGLAQARVGHHAADIGRAIEAHVQRGGFAVIRELGGHGIGRTIHEEPFIPNYDPKGRSAALTLGLVITIEPIICTGSPRVLTEADGWTVRTRDRGLSAHHEETVVITTGEAVLITAA
jgi:methionyl aminopeptidase